MIPYSGPFVQVLDFKIINSILISRSLADFETFKLKGLSVTKLASSSYSTLHAA